MKKELLFFTSQFPFGDGETFIENEIVILANSFDRIKVISNVSSSVQTRTVPSNVKLYIMPYELSPFEKQLSILGLFSKHVWREIRMVRNVYKVPLTKQGLNTILISWHKAKKYARIIKKFASESRDMQSFTYAYWCNDIAISGAIAKKRGWVSKAICRAHGWDVYFERAGPGFLPFRNFIAQNLDIYSFISQHGMKYTLGKLKNEFTSIRCSYLAVPFAVAQPIARQYPFRIISCSNLIALKRVHLIIEALSKVDFEVEWTHLGDGYEKQNIEKLITNLPGNVTATLKGRFLLNEVMNFYHSWKPSLFINVSEFEGIPVSMMEAMSVGIPVIGTNVGGVSELIDNEKNGILLSSSPSIVKVAESIKFFYHLSDKDYKVFSMNSWETWESKFNAVKNYTEFVSQFL